MDLITSKNKKDYNRAVLALKNDLIKKVINLDNDLEDVIYWELYLGLLGEGLNVKISTLLYDTIQLENA